MAVKDSELLKIGGRFGDFEVLRRLGKGGMGEVYLLRSPNSGMMYAAKIMYPSIASTPEEAHEWRRRFENEATFAMKVQHRNLIRVYDVGEDPETHYCYIIMDYITGGTLTDLIKSKGQLPVEDAIIIAEKVALALEVAHRSGVVHRDIKPDNIMFDDKGEPRLADLGIAKFAHGTGTTTMTKSAVVIGTPSYMAPEQMMDSHKVDARADIYSLGIVLYEMLTGVRPHADSSMIEILAKAVNEVPIPDVRNLRPKTPAAVAYAISRLAAIKREKRPSTALAAARLLHDAYIGKIKVPLNARRVAKEKKHRLKGSWRLLVPALIVSCAVLAASLIIQAGQRARTARPIRPGDAGGGGEFAAFAPDFPAVATNEVVVVITNTVVKTETITVVVTNSVATAATTAAPAPAARAVESAAAAPVPTSGEIQTVLANGYTWQYRLENGKAVLVMRHANGVLVPCISPHPSGEVFIPAELGGHPLVGLGDGAFANCSNITHVVIPDCVEWFGTRPFLNCTKLEKVRLPDALKEIKANFAFDNCSALKRVDFGRAHPDMWGKIPVGCMFRGCISLESIVADSDNPSCVSIDGMLCSRDLKEVLVYPKNRDTITLPQSVRKIGRCAMTSLSNIKKVVIPEGVEVIDSYAFEWSPSPTSYELPKSLKTIMYSAFKENAALTEVVFNGDAPANAGGIAFEGAPRNLVAYVKRDSTGWSAPGSSVLPEKWPKGSREERAIRFVDETEKQARDRNRYNAKDKTVKSAKVGKYTWYYTLQNAEAVIGRGPDGGRCAVHPKPSGDVAIPAELDGFKVTAIDKDAFKNCYSIKSVAIPEGVRTIDKNSFFGCTAINSFSFPSSLTCFNADSPDFYGGTIPALDFGDGMERRFPMNFPGIIKLADDNPAFTYSSVNEAIYTKDMKTLVFVPRNIYFFSIPRQVRKIGDYAFCGSRLSRIKIPNSVEEIGKYAFSACKELDSVQLGKGVRTIGDFAFFRCEKITSVTFGRRVQDVGVSAFEQCFQLRSVTIPASLHKIGKHAFDGIKIKRE